MVTRWQPSGMDVFLETDRLVLRPFTADDVDNLVDLDGDPAVMRYLTGGKPTSRAQNESETLPRFLGRCGYLERYAWVGPNLPPRLPPLRIWDSIFAGTMRRP